jgi:hypothetical protein
MCDGPIGAIFRRHFYDILFDQFHARILIQDSGFAHAVILVGGKVVALRVGGFVHVGLLWRPRSNCSMSGRINSDIVVSPSNANIFSLFKSADFQRRASV